MGRRFALYLEEDTFERWVSEAEKMGMSRSEWGQSMIAAGHKKFSRAVQPDQSRDELRQQRNDLRQELQRTRERVEALENQVHTSERRAIVDYLEDHPGATFQEILQHVMNTASARIPQILDQLEGDEVDIDEEGKMYIKR